VSTTVADTPQGAVLLENDRVRILLGSEGAHLYRWEVRALGDRDLCMPGHSGWAGFSDMRAFRTADFALTCLADGPALVRYACEEPLSGVVKTISLYAGCSWVEVTLNMATTDYWDFDNPANFAADGPTPGAYLFSNGDSGPVGRESEGVPAQVRALANWGIKFGPDGLALGIVTPEVEALHHVAPGAGAGGAGIENSAPAAHFVTFAGLLEADPATTMARLRTTLDLDHQPRVALYALEERLPVDP
jgi:hypothetical protein